MPSLLTAYQGMQADCGLEGSTNATSLSSEVLRTRSNMVVLGMQRASSQCRRFCRSPNLQWPHLLQQMSGSPTNKLDSCRQLMPKHADMCLRRCIVKPQSKHWGSRRRLLLMNSEVSVQLAGNTTRSGASGCQDSRDSFCGQMSEDVLVSCATPAAGAYCRQLCRAASAALHGFCSNAFCCVGSCVAIA